MKSIPDRSSASAVRGWWFVFDHADHRFAFWASAITGKEELYLDGRLVSESRGIRLASGHAIEVDGSRYEVVLKVTRLARFELACALVRDGNKVAGFRTRMVSAGLPVRIGTAAVLGAFLGLSLYEEPWWVWPPLVVLLAGLAWASRGPRSGFVVVPDDGVEGAAVVASEPIPQGALGAWWRQGPRSAFLLTPAWAGLKTSPAIVGGLVLVPYLIGILVERLYISGAATFHASALHVGWLSTALALWVCWVVALPTSDGSGEAPNAPGAMALFSMLAAQVLPILALLGLVYVPIVRMGLLSQATLGFWGWWAAWLLPLAWAIAAQSRLIWQSSEQRPQVRFAACLVLAGVAAFSQWSRPLAFWYPAGAETAEGRFDRFELTQDILEQQPKLLATQLQALAVQRPGVVDVYAITYAPYADENVFRRESAMVVDVMEKRFDAQGRTIQLVNHRQTASRLAWATPLNLKRSIERASTLMDRDEDILLIHLTSHGASNGTLATRHWPLAIDALTPTLLREWLDAANVRYRIVSVSACYSGSWIEPLADQGTLVVTAADSEHTSFGCGKGSDLTFYGRAMFDEELRRTWSFAEAHAAARITIDQRERAAGKSDGFSNPQIRVGKDIEPQLSRLAAERAGKASR